MSKLREYYNNCWNINLFANKMCSLWKSLPNYIQNKQPFWTLSYADDSLTYGDNME